MYLLVIPVFFIEGMAIAGLSGVAEGAGLAGGGAIVFFYGVITAIIAFILALFVAHKTKFEIIKKNQRNSISLKEINKIIQFLDKLTLANINEI